MLSKDDLKICFLLKVGTRFYSEQEIAVHIQELKRAVAKGTIDLYTTDGAVSIKYNDEELLGVEFWDEICLAVNSIVRQFDLLLQGQVIAEFLPLQTFWLRLTPQGERVIYELESKTSLRPLHVKRSMPLTPFVREFELMFWRMAKILANLGSQSFSETLNDWQSSLPLSVLNVVGDEAVKQIVEGSLEDVLSGDQNNN
jgi:hypothetical protein